MLFWIWITVWFVGCPEAHRFCPSTPVVIIQPRLLILILEITIRNDCTTASYKNATKKSLNICKINYESPYKAVEGSKYQPNEYPSEGYQPLNMLNSPIISMAITLLLPHERFSRAKFCVISAHS